MFPDEKYQKLTFSEEWLAPLLTPYKNLLNIGFLNKIFENGEAYDSSQDPDKLANMKELLKA